MQIANGIRSKHAGYPDLGIEVSRVL